MPRSPRTRHVRFYDILRQICRCPTGGQRRPPLQGCYEVAEHCAILQLRTAGSMRRPRASFEAQPRAARLLAPKMGIDPYGHRARSPFVVRNCWRVLRGRGRTLPLRKIILLHYSRFTITYPVSPTLRRSSMWYAKGEACASPLFSIA